jgi:pimeloyl-ACP methyl ester carboxylesterase
MKFAHVRFWKLSSLAVLLLALSSSVAFANAPADYSFNVSLRGTGSATIHASIFNNPQANHGVVTIMAVHGLAERATMFAPLADAIFADAGLNAAVKRIVSIDMVAHGDSSAPTLPGGLLFSNLAIEDNISVVIQAIDALRAANMGPQVIMGHSMGGLAVQGAQEALLAQGSSLAKHGVYGAILIAAVPNRGSVWHQPPAVDVTPFLVNDPVLGLILDLPAAAGPSTGAFATLSSGGTALVPNVPSVATFVINDWIGPEPITTLVELTGSNPATRPYARPNAFALQNATVLTVLSFSQDVLTPAVDQGALYTYLTGLPSTGATLYRPIVAADAVHSMYISNPTGLIAALKNGVIH